MPRYKSETAKTDNSNVENGNIPTKSAEINTLASKNWWIKLKPFQHQTPQPISKN